MNNKTIAALAGSVLLAAGLAQAKEGGDQYPNGAENWFAGAVPPPGNYFINYFGYYSGKLKDQNGDKLNVGGQTPKVDAVFDALRFLQVTNFSLFGGNWGWHVIVPVVHQRLDIAPLGGRASETGIGDITVNPLILSWHHSPQWHTVVGLDINLPTGAYDENDPRQSIGANYFSFEPIFAVSYLGADGWEASAKFMYNIKTRNDDTDYDSGDEFHMDYLVGKTFGNWGVGLSGYFMKQITDDKQNGRTVGTDGNKGQVFAIGPSVKYQTAGGTILVGQWQHETNVENRFGGDKVWLKVILPF
ncbi:MAG: transporter [Candidatus Competibacter sp.]|nr:transporter [Candidatus Competibacter sp.]